MNAGGYLYSEPHLARILRNLDFADQTIHYIGRRQCAVPAVGNSQQFKKESAQLQAAINKL